MEKLRKELKEKKCGLFKCKGNKIQYKLNEELKKQPGEAALLVGSPEDTNTEQLKKLLAEGIELLNGLDMAAYWKYPFDEQALDMNWWHMPSEDKVCYH